MKNIIKILSISLAFSGANLLLASDELTDKGNSATSIPLQDVSKYVDDYKKEELSRIFRYVDAISIGATQFLDDSVPVGATGQPVDRSCLAFKEAIKLHIMAQEVSPLVENGTVNLQQLRELVKWSSIAAVDMLVGINLNRCGNEMLHGSVTAKDHSSGGFLCPLFTEE